MSSLVQGSQQVPNSQRPTGIDSIRSVESGVIVLPGSFRGFTGSAYDARFTRGHYFTVTSPTTGFYTVTLRGVVPQTVYSSTFNTQAPSTTAVPGWPQGVMVNPQAFVTNDVNQSLLPAFFSTTGTSVTSFSTIYCTPFNATTNSFTIQCYGAGVLPSLPLDVATTDRLNFQLAFKTNGYTP